MQYSEGQLLDGRYELKEFIGSGSFGEVWLAIDNQTDLEVAVKIYVALDSDGLEDFKKEFKLSFNLNHTNLLHANYLGVNTQDSRPYLVMPYCPDGSVSKRAGNMSEREIWRFIRDVASGLAYLHEQDPPIIHQDIKPDNILILKSGSYVITDFGISKQLKSSLRKSAMNINTTGSIAYMGPERFSKEYRAIKASDIWSLGVTIYELIMNDMPFCGMGGGMQKRGAEIPNLPEEFSECMTIIFNSCLAEEPWNRPSARQVAEYASRCYVGEIPRITWNYTQDNSCAAVPIEAPLPPEPPTMPESVGASGAARMHSTPNNSTIRIEGDNEVNIHKTPTPHNNTPSTNDAQPNKTGKIRIGWIVALIAVVIVGGVAAMLLLKDKGGDVESTPLYVTPAISEVSTPTLRNNLYAFNVTATGDNLLYCVLSGKDTIAMNNTGIFSNIPASKSEQYSIIAVDSITKLSAVLTVSGFKHTNPTTSNSSSTLKIDSNSGNKLKTVAPAEKPLTKSESEAIAQESSSNSKSEDKSSVETTVKDSEKSAMQEESNANKIQKIGKSELKAMLTSNSGSDRERFQSSSASGVQFIVDGDRDKSVNTFRLVSAKLYTQSWTDVEIVSISYDSNNYITKVVIRPKYE